MKELENPDWLKHQRDYLDWQIAEQKTVLERGYTSFRGAKTYAIGPSERGTIPTAKQLEKINQLTRRPFNADELYVGSVMLANDQIDRAYEWFPVDVLKQFAKTIVTRNVLACHNKEENLPMALYFDASVVKEGDINWLKTWYYMPKTDENEHARTMLDAGVYRYSSIGFSPADGAGDDEWGMGCDICGKNYLSMAECQHYAGTKYGERGEDLTCTVHYTGKWQAVEGSIVYLGCQYGAEMKSNTEPSFEKLAEWQAMQEKLTEGYAIERAYLFTKSFEGITVPRRKSHTAIIEGPAGDLLTALEDSEAEIAEPQGELIVELSAEEIDERHIGLIKLAVEESDFVKSGRVLSASNESKLRQCHEIIGNVLEAVSAQTEQDAAPVEIETKEVASEVVEAIEPDTSEVSEEKQEQIKDLIDATVRAYANEYISKLTATLNPQAD